MKKAFTIFVVLVLALSLVACQGAKTYTVTFDVDGVETQMKVTAGAKATRDDPKKQDYIFTGWFREKELTEKFDLKTTAVDKDLTLFAGWREILIPQNYQVTFDLDGGVATPPISAQSVADNGTAIEPTDAPVKYSFKFVGWYLGEERFDFSTKITASITLKAKWKTVYPSTEGAASATTEATGHAASLANDGDADTFWQAAQADMQSLTFDLGATKSVRSVKQTFAASAVWEFKIQGSADNQNWADFADSMTKTANETYTTNVNGYFRYVRLVVTGGGTASSREFYVEIDDLSKGTDIALGMKGTSSEWSAGHETEMAFDGNYDTFWCAANGDYPKYLAEVWNYLCFVDTVCFTMPDEGRYNYEVEARLADGNTWIKLENASDHVGKTFTLEVGQEVSGILIRLIEGPGWPAVTEINVYGFKNESVFATRTAGTQYTLYDLGDSFVRKIALPQDKKSAVVEYSEDNATWKPFTESVYARYIRIAGDVQAAIYATPFKNDLARYVVPTASDFSEAGFRPEVCTMNPENTWMAERFWCAAGAGGDHTLSLDFGNVCILQSYSYKFQDPITHKGYMLKIELSLDAETWSTVFDNMDNPLDGQIFAGNLNNIAARYVKITVNNKDSWTNCKQLQFFGIGAPVRNVEIR